VNGLAKVEVDWKSESSFVSVEGRKSGAFIDRDSEGMGVKGLDIVKVVPGANHGTALTPTKIIVIFFEIIPSIYIL
jgi:hypothetical protein